MTYLPEDDNQNINCFSFHLFLSLISNLAATQQPLSLPEGEITTIEIHRSNPYIQLGISIVGGNETPLINIVIQEVYRDGIIARDGRLLAGDQILQVSVLITVLTCVLLFLLISLIQNVVVLWNLSCI